MKSIHIDDKKNFTARLFLREDFDGFYLVQASITTFNTYEIDGKIQKNFYTNREYEELGSPQYSLWGDLRKLCFEMIKGTKTPVKFKIVLKLAASQTKQILDEADTALTADDVSGLYLNIRYENETMDCITAATLNIFTMDKSVEEAFESYAERKIRA